MHTRHPMQGIIASSSNPARQVQHWICGIVKDSLAAEVSWLFLLTLDILASTSSLESVMNSQELISGF